MAVRKPSDKTAKPVPVKPTNEGKGHTTSTSNLEPVSLPKGERNTGGVNKNPVTLKHGPGNKYKGYDQNPEWDKYVIAEVLWIDAVANAITEWMDIEDLQNVQPCETLSVGYLITDHPEWVTLIGLMNDSTGGHAITIPRGMILNVRALHR